MRSFLTIALLLGCREDECKPQEEPAEGANLQFEPDAVLAALSSYAPSEIMWEGVGPEGRGSHPASVEIDVLGEGYVYQYRRPDGSKCSSGGPGPVLFPVALTISIGDGQLTANNAMTLSASSVNYADMVLYSEEHAYLFNTTIEDAWLQACAEANPDGFSSPPEQGWVAYMSGLEPIIISIEVMGEQPVLCWSGSIWSTSR